jgi:putative oxidoreductase
MTLLSPFRRLAFAPLPAPAGFFALPLRLIVGYGFLEHGYAKLARGPDAFIAILHAMGMPFAFFLGWATIVIEAICGLLILFGAFVPVASVPMIVVLLVATFTSTFPTALARSNSSPTIPQGRILDHQAMRPTYSVSRRCLRSVSAAPGGFR